MAVLYELHFDGIPIHINTKDCAEIKKGSFNDIKELVCCQNKEDIFLKRFKSGDYCLLAVVDGKVVGYEWFCTGSKHIEERYGFKITIPENALYAYDAFISPDYRKKGIWSQLISASSDIMCSKGKDIIISLVEYGNEASMNAHTRFSFYPVQRVLYFNICGLKHFKEEYIEDNQKRINS